MNNTLLKIVSNITDKELIKSMLLNMTAHDVTNLHSLLELADETVKVRWMTVYEETLKF